MIAFVTYKNIDKDRWDSCITNSSNSLIYAYSWYLDAVCESSWNALIMDDYVAVMPLCKKSKLGIHYLYQPLFAQQLGVFSNMPISATLTNDFISHIPAKYKYLDVTLNFANNCTLPDSALQLKTKVNIELNLNKTYEILAKASSDNLKRNIKKINTSSLHIDFNRQPEPIIELFRTFKGAMYPDIKTADYQRLANLSKVATGLGKCISVGITNITSKELLAGAIFMITDKRIIFLFSGLSEQGKSDKAMFYLINEIIKKYANQPIIFDFEGSNDVELARFYKGFGGKEVNYTALKMNRLPKLLRWIKS